MKLALELAQEGVEIHSPNSPEYKVCAALIEALAKQEQGEPVAIHQFRHFYCADWYDGIPDQHDGFGPYEVRTLYTTPQQRTWVGLTDEEINQAYADSYKGVPLHEGIEAKLKEKNT